MMFLNYIKIAWRNLLKFKGYASINILGLALGLACCLLIVQFLRYELTFDKHHDKVGDIYRVSTEFQVGDRMSKTGTTPSPLVFAIKEDFPEVLEAARVFQAPNIDQFLLKFENRSFFEEKGLYADSTFFRLFKYDFLQGDPDHALDEPFTIVLSSELAEKLFGKGQAIGQTIKVENLWEDELYRVTGIFDKNAYRSHIDGDFFISAMSGAVGRRFYHSSEWAGNNLFYTYIQLQPGVDAAGFEAMLPKWLEGYAADRLREMGFQKKHFLEPVKSLYLYSEQRNPIGPHGSITYVFILLAVAALILLIACINFMNLATAKAMTRAQEVGVRKVIGATKVMLMKQFLSEAFLYTSIGIIVAYVIAKLSLPTFNELTGRALQFDLMSDWAILPLLLLFVVCTTLLAGSYPALYLSSFNPVRILKGNLSKRFSARQLRRAFVIFQFIISIALIQGILVINEQMNYIRNKNLGFNAQQKLIFPLNSPSASENVEVLKNEFSKDQRVVEIAGTSTYPGGNNMEDFIIYGEGQTQEEGKHSSLAFVEPEFLDLMEFQLTDGRFFDRNRLIDTSSTVVINEKLAKGIGYNPGSAVGKRIFYNWGEERFDFEIIGVVKDFHESTMHHEIDGYSFFWNPRNTINFLIASVRPENMPDLLASLESSWRTVQPDEPFEYYFLDEEIQENYLADQQMSGLIFWATILAIFISCLGLLGLAAFAAERRTKEIGVRKVLGASVSHILSLLSKDFLLLIALAFVIASPLAWLLMKQWLANFHYHTEMPWWAFLLAGLLTTLIAIATIGLQAYKAARSNPVRALKTE